MLKRTNRIKEDDRTNCWWDCGAPGTRISHWQKCKIVHALWNMVWQFLIKLNMYLPCDLTRTPLVFTQKKQKHVLHNPFYNNVHSSFIHNSQKLETAQVSVKGEWPNTWWCAMNYYSLIKRTNTRCWMSLKNIMLSERSSMQNNISYVSFLWNVITGQTNLW